MKNILSLVFADGNVDKASEKHLFKRVPFLEVPQSMDINQVYRTMIRFSLPDWSIIAHHVQICYNVSWHARIVHNNFLVYSVLLQLTRRVIHVPLFLSLFSAFEYFI